MPSLALAFHAERLHDERVWRRTEHVAALLARRGSRATFFVYPFRAHVAGRSIAARVRVLRNMGHEIGQHTHFYLGAQVEKPRKVTDMSDRNVLACLRRDCAALDAMGARPRGFTAGAWRINDTILQWLASEGFVYDCSARYPRPDEPVVAPDMRWLAGPRAYSKGPGRLLCLPTTCSVGEWFKGWGRARGATHPVVYLHDYDLLAPRYDFLTRLFVRLGQRPTTCLEMVRAIGHADAGSVTDDGPHETAPETARHTGGAAC